MRIYLATLGLAACLCSCRSISEHRIDPSPLVGTWLVKIPEAPFPYHMFSFHPDGTVLQSNPDAGDPRTSDSNGMGIWRADADRIKGKFVEVTADRTTHRFVSRGEISFSIKVNGDSFSGTASAAFYDSQGRKTGEPVMATMEGQRVIP